MKRSPMRRSEGTESKRLSTPDSLTELGGALVDRTKRRRSLFGEVLHSLRTKHGMSQEDLAEAAGVSAAAVSALERGSRQAPYRETALLLADALELSDDDRRSFERAAAGARAERIRSHRQDYIRSFPVHLGTFVGRTGDLRELSLLLTTNRLVTLTGAGGIGKTRVALEVARTRAGPHDEAYFVDLAPLGDGTLILGSVAAVLGAPLTNRDEQLQAIASTVRQRTMLLIVDNCEHLVGAASAAFDAMLRSCPNVSIFATSRQRIGIPGEAVYRLSTLPLPAKGVEMTAGKALVYAALELFVKRAQAADSSFVLTDNNANLVADVCRRLDGIPLAIEFAAARVASLGLPMLHARLSERFDLLAGAASTVPARQQTMRAAIAWSCDLLSPREQTLTSRLSIFRDGWTVEAAEATCGLAYDNLDEFLDDLSSLVEKSIVSLDGNASRAQRYRLLEPIREYAHDRLELSEGAALSRRHAEWAARTVERWTDLQFTTPRLLWNYEIADEAANVRAALTWALGVGGDALLAARIAAAPRTIGSDRALLETMIAGLDSEQHPDIAGRLWWRLSGEYSGAEKARVVRNAIPLFERSGNRTMLAVCSEILAVGLAQSGKLAEGEAAILTAQAIRKADGGEHTLPYAFGLIGLGDLYFLQGRTEDQRAALKHALSLAVALDDQRLVVRLRLSLGELEFSSGHIPLAIRFAQDVVFATNRADMQRERMMAFCNLAAFRLMVNLPGEAAAAAREALELGREREPIVVARAVGYLAAVSALRGRLEMAARLHGYFQGWCERETYLPNAMEAASAAIVIRTLEAELAAKEIAALAAEGAALTEQRAVAEARLSLSDQLS